MEIKGYQYKSDLSLLKHMSSSESNDFYRVFLKWGSDESLSFIASKSEKDSLLSVLHSKDPFTLNIYGEDDVEKFSMWVNSSKLYLVEVQKG